MKTISELHSIAQLIGTIPERDFVSPRFKFHKSRDNMHSIRVSWVDEALRRFEIVYFADDQIFSMAFAPDLESNHFRSIRRKDLFSVVRNGMDWLYGPMRQ